MSFASARPSPAGFARHAIQPCFAPAEATLLGAATNATAAPIANQAR